MGIKEWWANVAKNSSTKIVDTPGAGYTPEKAKDPINSPPKDPSNIKKPRKPRKPKKVVEPPVLSAKDLATQRGEPWVEVTGIEVDMDQVENGSFSLDWNDKFVANLVRAGYKGKTDADIVDQWFQTICRNILTEQYEQEMADPTNRNRK